MIGLILAVTSRVLVGVLTAEVLAWLPNLSRSLVLSAARPQPPECRERFTEEWQAEIDAYGERRLAALKWAISLRLRAHAHAVELGPTVPARAGTAKPNLANLAEAVTALEVCKPRSSRFDKDYMDRYDTALRACAEQHGVDSDLLSRAHMVASVQRATCYPAAIIADNLR
jgi:hypothetical protein